MSAIPTGRAEELRRRLVGSGVPGLPKPRLIRLAYEAIQYAAELERRIAEAERRLEGG